MSAVFEVTEQTADGTGGGDVVVEIRHEGNLIADDFGPSAVGRLEYQFFASAVDSIVIRAGGE